MEFKLREELERVLLKEGKSIVETIEFGIWTDFDLAGDNAEIVFLVDYRGETYQIMTQKRYQVLQRGEVFYGDGRGGASNKFPAYKTNDGDLPEGVEEILPGMFVDHRFKVDYSRHSTDEEIENVARGNQEIINYIKALRDRHL